MSSAGTPRNSRSASGEGDTQLPLLLSSSANSAAILSPPLLRHEATAASQLDSGSRPVVIAVAASVSIWLSLAPLVVWVADRRPLLGSRTLPGSTAASQS